VSRASIGRNFAVMSYEDTKKTWGQFESDVQKLAGELKRHYRKGADENETADLNESLDELRKAAASVFKSIETATKDPDVRQHTKETARSFGSAMAETFRDLSDEIEKAVRKKS
jgi:predicted  nucleic acid-binding Zn-ribbon protein